MLVEGSSLRSISRITGTAVNTIIKLQADVGRACAAFHDEHVRNVPSRRIQVDERAAWPAPGERLDDAVNTLGRLGARRRNRRARG